MSRVITVVSGLIVNVDRKVLMALRHDNDKDYPNTWEVPGGKVNAEEDERLALKREMKEELGATPMLGDIIAVCSFNVSQRFNLLYYECGFGDEVLRPLEAQKLAWVDLRDCNRMRCMPSIYSCMGDLRRYVDRAPSSFDVQIDNTPC